VEGYLVNLKRKERDAQTQTPPGICSRCPPELGKFASDQFLDTTASDNPMEDGEARFDIPADRRVSQLCSDSLEHKNSESEHKDFVPLTWRGAALTTSFLPPLSLISNPLQPDHQTRHRHVGTTYNNANTVCL